MPYVVAQDGTKIAYRSLGQGPPLVCLAGGPGTDVRSLGNLGGLDRHRTLVLVDSRAAGASDVPADRSGCAYTEQVHDLQALRRHLGAGPVDVLAHSAGALTAQHYAASFPDGVRRLVLVAPAGRIGREVDSTEVAALRARRADEPWYRAAAEAAELLATGVSDVSAEEAQRRSAPFLYGRWTTKTRAHHEADRVQPPSWLYEAFYRGNPAEHAAEERLRFLRSVAVPVLVLAGAEDCVAGTRPAALTAELYRYGRLETVSGAGHHPWLDEPDCFRDLIEGFLSD
ncbi:alpha/beta fold hydrolase [Streptomyces sp. NPDC007808]|uniref:alpha/beta fold hydrolase n=1 Tax=Streptomyces sp. NPDC007808 TaxID=3364779 RepID=UPI003683E1DA